MTTIPKHVFDSAAAEHLGEPIRVYTTTPARRRGLVWVIILGAAGAGVVAGAVHFLLSEVMWAAALAAVLAVVYLVPAVRILVRDVIPGAGKALYLFTEGFVHVRRRHAVAYPWDSVRGVRMSGCRIGNRVRWRFVVSRLDGHEIVMGPEIPDAQNLAEAMSAEITERMLPKYLSRVNTGGRVEFGPFIVTRDGIGKDGEMVPWAMVREVGASNGVVYVSQAPGLMTLAATSGQVPNSVALLALADRILSRAA